jgi:polyphosphate kinase
LLLRVVGTFQGGDVIETRAAPGPAGAEPAGERGPGTRIVDRELSWLSFNARVLQEAADPTVPLFERLTFLGIFSSNLDEFFRVRVASLRSLLRLRKKRVRRLSLDPAVLLSNIHELVEAQQEWFDRLLHDDLLPELARRGVVLISEREVRDEHRPRVEQYFQEEVWPRVQLVPIAPDRPALFLENDRVYLVVEHGSDAPALAAFESSEICLLPIPSPPLPRFFEIEAEDGRTLVLFLDDLIRMALPDLFPGRRVAGAWAVKLSRDAELYMEVGFAGDVVEAIRRSLEKRKTGAPARFLYDPETPVGVITRLENELDLEPEDLVEGGRYHNLQDLRDFPRGSIEGETYPDWPPLPHPELSGAPSVREVIDQGDQLLYFPYHSYDHVVRFLTEAAVDPAVESIRLTVYRVSSESGVLNALLDAAERGKDVRVFVEVKARFDEEANLAWAERLEAAGIVTHYSFPDLKVHAKAALVVRTVDGVRHRHAYLGTGNFNEETAQLYADFALLTADPEITEEVERVFHFLEGLDEEPEFRHLMVAPFDLRERLYGLLEAERVRAGRGEDASVDFKLNALEDDGMIARLVRAAESGVRLRGVVRGICRLTGDESDRGGRIHLRSIVDRYLEHARAFVFGNGGDPLVYLSSADWMNRNLSRRVEIAFPIRDPACRAQVMRILELQLADNRKARRLDAERQNHRVPAGSASPLRSQAAIRSWLQGRGPDGGAARQTGSRAD